MQDRGCRLDDWRLANRSLEGWKVVRLNVGTFGEGRVSCKIWTWMQRSQNSESTPSKKILGKQDDSFRWGFDEKQARERPEYVYFWDDNIRSKL
jgi:hypothetical protein